METINDIVLKVAVEMINTSMQEITAGVIKGWATRLGDAATCEKSSQVGNAEKMRETVTETEKSIDKTISILEEIPETCGFAGLLDDACDVLCYLKEEFVKPALNAPARNCDLYATENEAYQAYLTAMKNKTKESYMYFESWLFAEAKGETK